MKAIRRLLMQKVTSTEKDGNATKRICSAAKRGWDGCTRITSRARLTMLLMLIRILVRLSPTPAIFSSFPFFPYHNPLAEQKKREEC